MGRYKNSLSIFCAVNFRVIYSRNVFHLHVFLWYEDLDFKVLSRTLSMCCRIFFPIGNFKMVFFERKKSSPHKKSWPLLSRRLLTTTLKLLLCSREKVGRGLWKYVLTRYFFDINASQNLSKNNQLFSLWGIFSIKVSNKNIFSTSLYNRAIKGEFWLLEH